MASLCFTTTYPIRPLLAADRLKSAPRRRERFPASFRLPIASVETASVTTVDPPSEKRQVTRSFGRGSRFPRRAVGLYELERVGINPYNVFQEGNSRNDAAFGGIVAAFVATILGASMVAPGVSIEGPVSLIGGALLAGWTVDSLAFGSLFSSAASASLQSRSRVSLHEAGHFLVAYLYGVPVERYLLPSGKAVLQSPKDIGVQVDLTQVNDVYALAAIGMAGVAAECKVYGTSEGGSADFAEVCKTIKARGSDASGPATSEAAKRIARWGLLQASMHFREHPKALDALAQAMRDGCSVSECYNVIDREFNWEHAPAGGSKN